MSDWKSRETPRLATLKRELSEKDALIARLREALEQSVALQSHYARVMNMYDGGKRIEFKNADEWLKRLAETTE